jgi:hypothetical protein
MVPGQPGKNKETLSQKQTQTQPSNQQKIKDNS